ncbi:MAG TPA: M28 family peptidase [Gemmatimonadaceae bacterium]|nr:M28 family peptidase [Gemmatimonadaceae bacterium]
MLSIACALLVVVTACDQLGLGRGPRTAFSGESALRYARIQVEFGPRVPGTEAHRRAGDWIVEQMRARADTVIEQTWTHQTANGVALPMRNILARIRPDLSQRVLYVAHWDTRPVAEKAQRPEDRSRPIEGANDGASGVALLIALADALQETPPQFGVDLLFVDGEDYGDFDTNTDVLIGSRYFARNLPSADYRPIFGVVWDMVGAEGATFYQEGYSLQGAPEVVSRVWQTAADLGYSSIFVQRRGIPVTDDHLPMLEAGLRVIDVIDVNESTIRYPYHHTLEDTIDKLSPRTLQAVGDVAVSLVTP